MRRAAHREILAGILLALAAFAASPSAAAAPPESAPPAAPAAVTLTLLATAVADGNGVHPARESDADLLPLARSLDALLVDTAQDLGMAVARPPRDARLGDAELLDRSRSERGLVVLPTLRAAPNGRVELRLALADPGRRELDQRTAEIARDDLAVRAVILLRDLVGHRGRAPVKTLPPAPAAAPPSRVGRITLIANAVVFGGLAGYSIQRASGSDDARLLVPLIGVGAGIGFGAAFVVSGEWEVSTGSAWYAAAGAWWPTLAAHLIYEGRFSATRPESERWLFGLLGGGAGVTLATLGLALHPMSDGGALIAHSGGGLGMLFGAVLEVGARGDIHQTPFAGMGYGAGLGWLAAAAVATQVEVPPSRVLAFDAGAALGGLAGAAASSPLLLGSPGAAQQRAWAGITAGSAVIGATAMAIVMRPSLSPRSVAGAPLLGVVGESEIGSRRAPVLGIGWSGTW